MSLLCVLKGTGGFQTLPELQVWKSPELTNLGHVVLGSRWGGCFISRKILFISSSFVLF